MFNLIIFGGRIKGESSSCFMVGINGCNEIIENHIGVSGGIDVCNYTVTFDDGGSIEINNIIYVTDSA